jgi:cell division protein FtsL
MIRILNVVMVGCLIVAAVTVYEVKYQSTYKAQAVARLNGEIRAEREKIATLNAERSRLATPERIQTLAERYLGMKALDVSRIDDFSALPEKPAAAGDPLGDLIESLPSDGKKPRDALGSMIETLGASAPEPATTGSVGPGN